MPTTFVSSLVDVGQCIDKAWRPADKPASLAACAYRCAREGCEGKGALAEKARDAVTEFYECLSCLAGRASRAPHPCARTHNAV